MKKLLFITMVLFHYNLLAQLTLLKDINLGMGSSYPDNFVNVAGKLYFSAFESTGTELYKSSGTASTTLLVRDINPGPANSSPSDMVNLGGKVLFTALNDQNGREIWISDGTTAGTTLLKDLIPGTLGSDPKKLTVIGTTAFFCAYNSLKESELWKTDGTAAGTLLVKKLITKDRPSSFTNLNGSLYFLTDGVNGGDAIWKSNGTSLGTVLVKNMEGQIDSLASYNGKLYFSHSKDGYPWVSDGTTNGTTLLKDVKAFGSAFVAFAGNMYFRGETSASGAELWKTNGTTNGTILVKDINTGAAGSLSTRLSNNFIVSGSNLFFIATKTGGERTLFKTNGTTTGTVQIVNAPTFLEDEDPYITSTQYHLYFTQYYSLWTTDGTEAGTSKIRQFDYWVGPLGRVYGDIYISAPVNTFGMELWKYVPPAGRLIQVAPTESSTFSFNKIAAVYPTSFFNFANLKLAGTTSGNEVVGVRVLSLSGKLFSTKTVKTGTETEIGEDLPSGVYILQLETKTNKVSKIIIKE